MMKRVSLSIGAGLVLRVTVAALVPTSVAAQGASRVPLDMRWAAWLGCWSPVTFQQAAQDVQVCILPADDGTGVRMVTFAADQSLLEESVIADGAPHVVTEGDCEGRRQTRWARSGGRFLTTTELRCEGEALQQTSGLSTLAGDRWLDIQVSGPTGRESVRIRRYRRSDQNPPAPVADAVATLPRPLAVATSSLAIDDVIEAARNVSQKAVEAWLVETEPVMPINRQALRRLGDAHVPEPVINLLVALAYPSRFDVRTPSGGSGGGSLVIAADSTGPFGWAGPWAVGYDPYMQCYAPLVGWCAYGPYDYWWSSYYTGGYYGGGGYVTAPPLAPSHPIAPGPQGHGQVVNGQGYTQVTPREAIARGGDSQSGSGSSSTSSTSGSSFGGSAGSSGVSPGGYSSSGGGGGGVTAVPR